MNCVQSGLLKVLDNEDRPINNQNGQNGQSGNEIRQHKTVLHSTGQKIALSNYTVPTPASRLLTRDESELILEYLDLDRMEKEIEWLLSHCTLFPVVTAHNDYHSGNVLLLDSIDGGNGDDKDGVDQGAVVAGQQSAIAMVESPTPPPAQLTTTLASHAFSYPNATLPWIKVIDWEFGAMNYRGYDCANSSNEAWIVYTGGHPGFTLDLPGWVSTAFLGKYDPSVLQLDPNQSAALKDVTYQCFEHDAIGKMYNKGRLDDIVKIWSQKEDSRIGDDIQHILLGDYATKPYIKGQSGAPEPTYRPRELTWVEACLTGFYHSVVKKHYQTCPNPSTTPIYPFQTTSPPQPGFDPNYTLPGTVEEWLRDQVPKLLFETQIMQLASQLAWSFWGITFSSDGQMTEGFGYLEHALARMIAYVAKKEVMVKMELLTSPWVVNGGNSL